MDVLKKGQLSHFAMPNIRPSKMTRCFLSLALVLVPWISHAQNLDGGAKTFSPFRAAQCIRDFQCRERFVVAHASNGFGEPGDSLAALRKAVKVAVPILEIDIVVSKDNVPFILHAGDSWSQQIAQLTAQEVEREFRIQNGEPLPRLEQAYAITRGKAVLDLHFKGNAVQLVAEWAARVGSFDDFIFFTDNEEQMKAAARMKAKYPKMIVMARVHSFRWNQLGTVRQIFGGLPEIIHVDWPYASLVQKLHSQGCKVLANFWKAEESWFPELASEYFLSSGVDFIQTNDPIGLMNQIGSSKTGLKNHKPAY